MKTKQIIVLLAISILVFSNCKKGKNDPFLSLISRKARVSNEWKVSEWSVVLNQKDMNPLAIHSTSSLERSISDGLYHQKSTGSWGNDHESGTVNSAIWNIEKDNTWSKTLSFTSTLNSVTTTTTLKSSGTWYFLGKIDEYKNKERLTFNTLASTETKIESYANGTSNNSEFKSVLNDGDLVEVFSISQLKNKETVLEREMKRKKTSQAINTETEIVEKYKLVEK